MRKIYTPHPYGAMITDHVTDLDRGAVFAGMGMGKEQPVSEPVLTTDGWLPIGSLKVGDAVIGADGRNTEVIGVYPQGFKPVYAFHFADGACARAGLNHLWAVRTPKEAYQGLGYRVLTTRTLMAKGLRDTSGNRKWSFPLVSPVAFTEKALPVEPYLLGVLLGDGCLRADGSVSVTTDTEITALLGGRREPHPSEGIETLHLRQAGLHVALQALELRGKRSWEKHVPHAYLFASVDQRLALLQGLLDTDGYAMANGGVEFCSTAEALVDAVVFLTSSLGGIARNKTSRFTKYQGGLVGRESWRVNVKLPSGTPPFRLSRKKQAWVPPTKYPPRRMLDSIERVGREESVCIEVRAADHLYVTKDFVVTHNTVGTLTGIEQLILCGESEPTLVMAPLRVARSTWPDEAAKWDHLRNISVSPIVGSEIERRNALKIDASVFTTNYENLPWLVDHFGERWPFRRVVADESTKLKSYRIKQGGVRAQALGKVAYGKVKFFTELTGTPAPNGLLDLWGQMWFIDRGERLGRTFEGYKERWFRPDFGGGWSPLPNAQAEIEDRLRDVCLTVDAKDYFDLKKPIVKNLPFDLPVKVRKLYTDMEKELFMQFEGHEVTAFNAGAKSQKLLQIASGAVYVDPEADADEHPRSKEWREVHDVKIQILEDIIEEAAGMPVLVAYHFKSDLSRLLKAFSNGRVLDANPHTLHDWNAGKIPILFAHPASAGHGLNLQDGGNILVYFSHDWNLENRQQILERIGPMRQLQSGYKRGVFVYNIIARDTLDEAVIERTDEKASVQDAFLAAMKRRVCHV